MRTDFCLEILHGDDTLRVHEVMGVREADYLAAAVLARIRPRRSWSWDGAES